jgi:hypothetical protein
MSVAIGMPQPDAAGVPRECGVDEAGVHAPERPTWAMHPGRQLAHQHLPLDFEAHEQEKKRHEPVVDPMLPRELEPEALSRREGKGLLPELMDRLFSQPYGKTEGNKRSGDEHNAARRGAAKKLLERGEHAAEQRFQRVIRNSHEGGYYAAIACQPESDAMRIDSRRRRAMLDFRGDFGMTLAPALKTGRAAVRTP